MDPLLILIILALIAATVAMLLGVLVMSGGGATDMCPAIPMWVRVGFRAYDTSWSCTYCADAFAAADHDQPRRASTHGNQRP
jgi:hypothetical protein